MRGRAEEPARERSGTPPFLAMGKGIYLEIGVARILAAVGGCSPGYVLRRTRVSHHLKRGASWRRFLPRISAPGAESP
jgi:hypothetical protein